MKFIKLKFIRSGLLAAGLLAALAVCVPSAAVAQPSQTWTVSGSWGANGFRRAGDFNGDGRTDLIGIEGATVHMKLSTGTGFAMETWLVNDGSADWHNDSRKVLAGDFNCDGHDDLAVA